MTVPCIHPRESPDGTPYVEDDPARLTRLNQLIVQAHDRHPNTTSLVDFNAMICPGGQFSPQLDGVTIRSDDGIHFPLGELPPVAEKLLPVLRNLAPPPRERAGSTSRG
jgi:hypothetical protein